MSHKLLVRGPQQEVGHGRLQQLICAFHGTGSNHIHARVLLPCCQTHGLCPGFTKLYTRCVICQTEAQAHHCKKRSTSCHRMHEVTLRCAMRWQLVESTHTACSTGVAAAMELGCPYCVTPSPLSPHTLGGRRCHCREAATRPRREALPLLRLASPQ